jgi:hypothetical protein
MYDPLDVAYRAGGDTYDKARQAKGRMPKTRQNTLVKTPSQLARAMLEEYDVRICLALIRLGS